MPQISRNEYAIIFEMLIEAINLKLEIDVVNMPAIYFPNDFWGTKTVEIASFISALKPHFKENSFLELAYLLERKKQIFSFNFENIDFCFFYIEQYDSYIIQANINDLYEYWKKKCLNRVNAY